MELKGESDHRSLSIEAKLIVAWYNSLSELHREIVDSLVVAFQETEEGFNRFDVQAVLNGFEQGGLLAA